ncbi:MAG: UDP-N-acetylmuramate dehydrogenase [Candidatus Ratteibacteria bacterium]|nr:UDP-N-acetylmuramate dehydrogenase [Candidatus Ratteibacteria bacterium]
MKGKVKFAEPMRGHTTFAVGGPAEAWVEPRDIEDLKNLMVFVKKHKLNYLVVGKGSNIIVKDRGVRGLVINLSRYFRKIDNLSNGIEVQAGLDLSDLLWQLEKNGLTGLEFLKGIPGTVGGVIWMNAGLADKNIGEFVSRVKIINEKGEMKEFNSDQLQFAYRKTILPESGVIFEVTLKLAGGSKKTVKQVGQAYFQRKMESQPLSFASAGCIFKNPDGKPASVLIDKLNLKGCRQGGAEISSQHANFIIKKGETKAADILGLIRIIERKVKEKQGINLEKEIVVVGED